jgi:magnesium transporter
MSQPTLGHTTRRRKNHRGGKKKKSRRKSFAATAEELAQDGLVSEGFEESSEGFYSRPSHNLSSTSIDSEALLDHR